MTGVQTCALPIWRKREREREREENNGEAQRERERDRWRGEWRVMFTLHVDTNHHRVDSSVAQAPKRGGKLPGQGIDHSSILLICYRQGDDRRRTGRGGRKESEGNREGVWVVSLAAGRGEEIGRASCRERVSSPV